MDNDKLWWMLFSLSVILYEGCNNSELEKFSSYEASQLHEDNDGFNMSGEFRTIAKENKLSFGRGRELSKIYTSPADFSPSLSRKQRQIQQREECPPHFELFNSYCIRVSRNDTWTNAYQDCFRNGIEKTPLDIRTFWLNSSNFTQKLVNEGITSIWLAAERKVDGGPIYYSGPIGSDFNYSNYNAAKDFNITWSAQKYNVTNRCMILNLRMRTLDITSCEESLAFVCLFPSEFWTRNDTYDAFYKYEKSVCAKEKPMTWRDARDDCKSKYKMGDLLYKNKEVDVKKTADLYYQGRQNSILDNKTQIHREWFDYFTGSGTSLFNHFSDGFEVKLEGTKYFACVKSINKTQPGLYIKSEFLKSEISLRTLDMNEISLLFGIRCYLDGKIITKNKRASVVPINGQGHVFCETMSHMPVMLVKSNIIFLENPDILSYVFKIFISDQRYDFKLHDLTFIHNDSNVAYIQDLFKHSMNCDAFVLSQASPENVMNLQRSHILLLNVTDSSDKSGIDMEFRIELPGKINELENVYSYINFLLNSSDCRRPYANFTLQYLRNRKYCISEKQSLPGTADCKSNITWTLTPVGKIDECIECSTLLTRSCIGTLNTGARWESVKSSETDSHFSNVTTCNITNKSIRIALTKASTAFMYDNKFEPAETTDFIKTFEEYLFEKEENSTNVNGNTSVTVYSTSLLKDIGGFYRKQGETFKSVDIIDFYAKNIVAAIYLNLTNGSVLISHFENHPVFPHRTNIYRRISSVILIKISNEHNITFPLKIMFSLEPGIKSNFDILCGYWNETTMQWEQTKTDKFEGQLNNGLYNCSYYHLSCFALLLHLQGNENPTITLISEIGCYFSLTGLGLVLVAILVFHRWKDINHDVKLLFSLSLSLFLMFLLVVAGIHQTSNKELCIALGALLHYFSLASFCWMFAIAFHNYLKFVVVLGTYIPRFMWKVSSGALITPAFPVIVVLVINPQYYKHTDYCWLHEEGFEYGFLFPLCVIVLLNVTIYIRILTSICKIMEVFPIRIHNRNPLFHRQVYLSLCLFVMFGLSWVFGLLAVGNDNTLLSYLFCITASMQGFFIFILFILLEKTAKEKLFKYVCVFYKELQKMRFRKDVEECEQPFPL